MISYRDAPASRQRNSIVVGVLLGFLCKISRGKAHTIDLSILHDIDDPKLSEHIDTVGKVFYERKTK